MTDENEQNGGKDQRKFITERETVKEGSVKGLKIVIYSFLGNSPASEF